MIKYLLILALAFVGCNCYGQKKETHFDKFIRYSDSCNKYFYIIRTPCGGERYLYYQKLLDKEYKLMYPNGNPADKRKRDTTCYPMKP